jgi:hypothetical protein
VDDVAFMWKWLRAHAVPFYETYWTLRGMEEFEKIFGRKAFAGIDKTIGDDFVISVLRRSIAKATIHFGEGRLNASTIAWILAQVESEVCAAELGRSG